MIKAHKESSHKYKVYSDVNFKTATIIKYGEHKAVWQIVYGHNGARKNCDSYQACIDYLTSKGW